MDRPFDRWFGTETGIIVEREAQSDVSSPNHPHGIRYEPTRARPFRAVMRAAAIPPRGTFVDIGSGKGRVLILAAEYGFTRLTGVDYSPSLCAIARENVAAVQRRRGWNVDVHIHAVDAADYRFEPDDRVLFLFNPFDDTVLRRVLDNLRESLARHPRTLWLVYHRPEWRNLLDESGLFGRVTSHASGGCEFAVYRTRD